MSKVILIYCQAASFRPLKKGDTVPNLTITLSNGDSTFVKQISDFKDKLLILDFWATTCVDCIASMPKMVDLQNRFRDQIQIIVVTENTSDQVNLLWHRFNLKPTSREWVKAGKQLSFLTGDTLFKKLFPHKGLPTHVWIDKANIFKTIAYANSTTAENIAGLLAGKGVNLYERGYWDLNLNDPISLLSDDEIVGAMRTYSIFTNKIEIGMGSGILYKEYQDSASNNFNGLCLLNGSAVDLYLKAYSAWEPIKNGEPNNRLIINVKDIEKYIPPEGTDRSDWDKKNSYCYFLKVKPEPLSKLKETMRSDLDRFFKARSQIEKRTVKCIVLKDVEPGCKSNTLNRPKRTKVSVGDKLYYNLENYRPSSLFVMLEDVMNQHYPNVVFYNKLRSNDPINIQIPWAENYEDIDMKELIAALSRCGFHLAEEHISMDMLIIEEENNSK